MMKPIYSLSLLAWIAAFGSIPTTLAQTTINVAEESNASSLNWLTDMEEAKREAAETGKKIFVVFTGSDWCPPCQQLKKNVLDKREFQSGTSQEFVFVLCDFPSGFALSDKQSSHNEALLRKFRVRSYPTVVIADADGNLDKSISGYSGESYKDFLKKL